MKLSELKKDSAGGSTDGESSVAEGTPLGHATSQPPAEEPWGVAQVVTPSGLEVYYQAGPKRLYRIRQDLESASPHGALPWAEVPSASTVLSVLEKGGLSWWGMKVGIEGVQKLAEELVQDPDYVGYWLSQPVDGLVDLLKEHKLTVNHVKGQAADRGTNVHTALELYADTGTLPNPENYPESEAGYVRGLVAFLTDTQPVVEHSELMVASTEGFAGRFDLVARLDGEAVVKTYPKRADKRAEVSGRFLLDLKTSKGVYPSYHLQLAGYEGAYGECGYGTLDGTAVVRVTADGRYELVDGRATFEDFLTVLETYRVIQRLEGKA